MSGISANFSANANAYVVVSGGGAPAKPAEKGPAPGKHAAPVQHPIQTPVQTPAQGPSAHKGAVMQAPIQRGPVGKAQCEEGVAETKQKPPTPRQAEPGMLDCDTHVVKKGDTLSSLAKQHGVSWQQLYWANRDQIKHPDRIFPGQELVIPDCDLVVPPFKYTPLKPAACDPVQTPTQGTPAPAKPTPTKPAPGAQPAQPNADKPVIREGKNGPVVFDPKTGTSVPVAEYDAGAAASAGMAIPSTPDPTAPPVATPSGQLGTPPPAPRNAGTAGLPG